MVFGHGAALNVPFALQNEGPETEALKDLRNKELFQKDCSRLEETDKT